MKGTGETMRLNGAIMDATVGNFYDSVELQVVDMAVPANRKKKTYTVKIYDGFVGLAELRQLVAAKKQQFGQGFDPRQDPECQQAAAQIGFPQLLTTVAVDVYDISGKGKYINLVGQLA
jgi:hypothetical protein